ncbi:MAG: ROK family protein [Candidatus Kapaibacteriota bacterium]
MNYLGLDIGGTRTKFCVVDKNNNILFNSDFDYKIDSETKSKLNSEVNLELNLNKYSNLLNYNILPLLSEYDIFSIGIAFPGVVNRFNIVKSSPNMNFFEEINILEFISDKLNFDSKQIKIDNDANIAAICERFFIEKELIDNTNLNDSNLNKNELDNFLFVTLGTGIGGAIFIDGKIYNGANGGAGEIGHTFFSMKECLDLDNLTNGIFFNDLIILFENKKQNHFLINQLNSHKIFNYHECTIESYIGSNNFIKLINNIKSSNTTIKNNSKLYHDFSDLINAANHIIENKLELSIDNYFLNLYGFLLGISMSSAMNLLDLNHIILGGGCSNGYKHFEKIFKITLERRLLPHLQDNFKVSLSKYGNLSGSYGAAIFAKS